MEASGNAEVESAGGHDVEEVGASAITRGASSAFMCGKAPCMERCIVLILMEHSTRYAMLPSSILCSGC